MSWYRDPQLFVHGYSNFPLGFSVYRFTKEFGSGPIVSADWNGEGSLIFSEHLSLGNNKDSDYNAFKATFPSTNGGVYKFMNSRGLVIYYDRVKGIGSWSREDLNTPFWRLPGITRQKSVMEEALEGQLSNLEEKFSSLKDEVRDRDGKILACLETLEKQVSNLTLKLVQCCRAAGGGSSSVEPCIAGQAVPENWVPFKDLDVLPFSRNIPLTITKIKGGSKLGDDDKTTNVHASCFHQGRFPIMVVDVAELTPDREEARFDPCIWGLYTNAGISYAARKLFASEMSGDAHKTC